jgi:superfamily II DNA or RNA helicase
MTPPALWPHQVILIEKIDAALGTGERRIVAQAPTGYGKTMVAAAMTAKAIDQRKRVIFTVPALSLIDQTVEKFFAAGVHEVGVIQANHPLTNYSRPVQIASVQTLQRRYEKGDGLSRSIPDADLVLIDEAHRWFDFYEDWLTDPTMAGTPVIGLSATPWRRGLGKYFNKLIVGASTKELIDTGYLCKFRVFAPSSPDLRGVHTVAGDYHEGELGEVMSKGELVADVVDTWISRAGGRNTLVFAVNRIHAAHLQSKFQEKGIVCGYIDAYTDADKRKEIARAFHRGDIKVVCNVGCLTTGIDWDVRCIVLARPTKSEMLFTQMVGRGLRTAEGKDHCLILDHSDNHTRLGFVTDIHHDELDDGKPKVKSESKPAEALPKPCPYCAFLKPPKVQVCPSCGQAPQPKCTVVHHEGELVELLDRRTADLQAIRQDKQRFFQELRSYAAAKAYKRGWIAYKFKEKFGHWPNGLDHLPPLDPTPTTLSWIRSRQIAYAKAVGR